MITVIDDFIDFEQTDELEKQCGKLINQFVCEVDVKLQKGYMVGVEVQMHEKDSYKEKAGYLFERCFLVPSK